MQFYLNGYKPGDPDILEAAPGAENRSTELPEVVDVLVVGSGPGGALLAAQLSNFAASPRASSSGATARCRRARPTATPATPTARRPARA